MTFFSVALSWPQESIAPMCKNKLEDPAFDAATRGDAILRRRAHFSTSPLKDSAETLVYNMAKPFRICRGTVGFWCGLNQAQSGLLDHAAGSDLIWWSGGLNSPAEERMPLFRNSMEMNPLTGKQSLFMRFPAGGGFVATDQLLANGRPHPGAGTGFALCHVLAMPLEVLEKRDKAENGTWVRDDVVYRCLEIRQIRYASGTFAAANAERYHFDELYPGWLVQNMGMNAAVTDGESLLWPVAGIPNPNGTRDRFDTQGSIGISRWEFNGSHWRIQSIAQVDEQFCGYEPSLIRSKDGALLMTARIKGPPESWDKFCIPIWNSSDGGAHWQNQFSAERHRSNSPLVIGATPSGKAFVVGNLMVGGMNQRALGYCRELLALWILREDGSGLHAPRILRCGQIDYGLAPTENGWKLDHPTSAVVEDLDGSKVTLLTYRVQASDENRLREIGPTPYSGVHVEQILQR